MNTTTTRTPIKSLVHATLGAMLAVLSVGAAQAAPDDLARVEVSGRRPGEMPRTDVRANCPGVDAAIIQRVSALQYRTREEGLSTISFRLNGATVGEVHQSEGPDVYRQALRRAVASLQCTGPARDSLFVMQVRFRNDEDGTDPGNRVALVEFAPPAAGTASTVASAAGR
ncbi:hypothetical protein CDN99_03875 [Roseateles aquatilis]|uniref:TonB C-terminal domain-containing protein n=1 Tax=Roseateles aquatilis TaxID=431061 RepID=A0A246JLX8_9BURK|nr:hypothetical protein [Roseateles aquatilis]OWQ93607.1 hypothetical protein CDN99_03875 [Roseateles aquatilis]